MEQYNIPALWARYSFIAIVPEMIDARSMMMTLQHIPCQRMWIEQRFATLLQDEVAATLSLDGIDTVSESANSSRLACDVASRLSDIIGWLGEQYESLDVSGKLIMELHRRVMNNPESGAESSLRKEDEAPDSGRIDVPGPLGGHQCREAFEAFSRALDEAIKTRNPLIQAATIHYHLAVMRPFAAGNNTVTRLLETLLLMKAGMTDAYIAGLSRYYLEHSREYADALAAAYEGGNDLTPFVAFCLTAYARTGMTLMQSRLAENRKALFRDAVTRCFGTIHTQRKKIVADRQATILMHLLDHDPAEEGQLFALLKSSYNGLKNPELAFNRDIGTLLYLGTIEVAVEPAGHTMLSTRMDWPCEVDIHDFRRMYGELSMMNNKPLSI